METFERHGRNEGADHKHRAAIANQVEDIPTFEQYVADEEDVVCNRIDVGARAQDVGHVFNREE